MSPSTAVTTTSIWPLAVWASSRAPTCGAAPSLMMDTGWVWTSSGWRGPKPFSCGTVTSKTSPGARPSNASSRPATTVPVPCRYTSGSWPRVLVIRLPSSPVRVKWTVATRRLAISMGRADPSVAGARILARSRRRFNRIAHGGPAETGKPGIARLPRVLQRRWQSAAGSLVATLDLGPVDHLEERGDVVRAAVLVLQVVRVLPHVQAQDRGVARADVLHQRVVLVGGVLHGHLAVGIHGQPGPAAAEAALGGLGELLLELVVAAQLARDALGNLALGLAAAVGRHHRPEQRVVGVAAAVVAHRLADAVRQGLDPRNQLVDREDRKSVV